MRKRAILACLLAAAMLLSGCTLVEKDTAVDNATVIIQLGDKTVTKAEVNYSLEYQLYYQSMMYSMYGMSFDATDATTRAQALEDVLDSITKKLVTEKKAEELGFTTFTEEEDAKIKETAQSDYDTQKESVKSQYFKDTTLEGDELNKAIDDKMTALGATFEYFYEGAKADAAQEKLRNSVISSVTVTDEEIQTDFDSKVESAKTSYASNLSSYGSAVNSGTTVYYAPAGYRYVKHILRKFPDDTITSLSGMKTKVTDKETAIKTIDDSITALGTDVAKDDPKLVDLQAQKATAEQEKADLQAQYDKAYDEAAALLQPTVDEVLTKLAANEDFDSLMATYGEDPGMQKSPQKETGYAVCTDFSSFDPAFTQAAMALAKVGDVSPAVRGSNGIHIIKYAADIPEGPVALDTVKDSISKALLTTKQDDAYDAQVTQWITDSGIKVYEERMYQ